MAKGSKAGVRKLQPRPPGVYTRSLASNPSPTVTAAQPINTRQLHQHRANNHKNMTSGVKLSMEKYNPTLEWS